MQSRVTAAPFGFGAIDWQRPAALVVLLLASLVAAYGVVQAPWLTLGAVFGVVVLAVAISAPLALVALMLIIGPVDLSFMTGGFKSLFPELGGLDMNGIRLVGATAGFSAFIINAPRARAALASRLGLPYLAFLLFAFMTLAYSFDALEGLRLHLKLAYPLLTFLIVIGLADTRERLMTLTKLVLLSAAVIAFVINPLFTLAGGYRVDHEGFRRVRGLGAHENIFAMYCMIMLFLGFARLVIRRQQRYLWFCLAVTFWIALTLTRIAFLASLVGILVMTLLYGIGRRQYRGVLAGVAIVLAIVIPFGPPVLERSLGFMPTPGELARLMSSPMALYEAINWQGRSALWPIIWTGFLASPLIGLGLGSSSVVIAQHFPAEAAKVAHNEYLRLAADTGIVGVILFALAMIVWLSAAVRASVARDERVSEFALPAAAALLGWGIVAITDNPFDYYTPFTQYVGFLMAGVVVTQQLGEQEQDDHRLS